MEGGGWAVLVVAGGAGGGGIPGLNAPTGRSGSETCAAMAQAAVRERQMAHEILSLTLAHGTLGEQRVTRSRGRQAHSTR